jgi:hypothetical protein
MSRHDAFVRLTGYGLATAFALVGLLFLAAPGGVLAALDRVGGELGFTPTSAAGHSLYLALAVAYMYVVTVLAVLMARRPDEPAFATLLVHAKAASAVLSLALFAADDRQFAYLANFLVDAAIALFVWWTCARRPTTARHRGEVRAA